MFAGKKGGSRPPAIAVGTAAGIDAATAIFLAPKLDAGIWVPRHAST